MFPAGGVARCACGCGQVCQAVYITGLGGDAEHADVWAVCINTISDLGLTPRNIVRIGECAGSAPWQQCTLNLTCVGRARLDVEGLRGGTAEGSARDA